MILASYRTSNGTIRWVHEFAARDMDIFSNVLWEVGQAAQASDGTVFVTSTWRDGGFEPNWAIRAFDGETGSTKWATPLLPGDNWALGGPVAAGNSVYVMTRDCRLNRLDSTDGGVTGWYPLRGRPVGFTPQLVEGILYVMVWVSNGLSSGNVTCPFMADRELAVTRYGCLANYLYPAQCGPCITARQGGLYWLYAFKVE